MNDIMGDLFRQQTMRNKQESSSDGANEKDTMQHVIDSADNLGKLASRMLGMPNLSQAGQVSALQQFESKGFAEGTIPSLVDSLNTRGGIIAQIAHILVKNGVVTDHTVGVGADGSLRIGEIGSADMGAGGSDSLIANIGSFSAPATPSDAMPSGGRGGDVDIG